MSERMWPEGFPEVTGDLRRDAALHIRELTEALESMAQQFAYETTSDGIPALTTGGLSALEEAFGVLGWDDPHPVPERGCERDGCTQLATCGVLTPDGWKRLCGTHYRETF